MGNIQVQRFNFKNGEEFIIRTALPSDAEKVLHYIKAIFNESKYMLTTADEFQMTVEQERTFLENMYSQPGMLGIIAEYHNEIIGFLNFQNGHKKRTQHIGEFGMSVEKRFRHQGVGQKLLSTLLNWAEKNPVIEKVCLEVFDQNTNAIKLYEKMGFFEEGRKKRNIKISENEYYDIICMAKFTK